MTRGTPCQGCGIALAAVRHRRIERCAGYQEGCVTELAICAWCEEREPGRVARYRAHLRTCAVRRAKLEATQSA